MLNILVLAVGLLAQAQPSNEAATGPVISGRVVADDTGEPVPNARITVTPSVPNAPLVRTDRQGRFEVAVPANGLRIAVVKSGYVRREVSGRDAVQPLEIRLRRASAISGRILDQAGDPVTSAQVSVESVLGTGETTMPVKSATTDDYGEYRIGGLASGTFVVAVRVLNWMTPVATERNMRLFNPEVVRLYYPAVANVKDADRVRLAAGDDRSGIDISVPAQSSGGEPFAMAAIVKQAKSTSESNAAPARGDIRGRVVTTSGEPIAHARVRLLPQGDCAPLRTKIADEEGRFAFADIPVGSFLVAAAKDNCVTPRDEEVAIPCLENFGAGPLVTLVGGESRSVEISLARLGAISGYVTDERGDAVEGARVELLQVRYAAGRRSLVPADAERMTDDRGYYRVFGVSPGHYIVSASVGSLGTADLAGYARTYFPGSSVPAQAQFVAMSAAQDVSGIDFALERAPTAHVSGSILDAAGEPTTGGSVRIIPAARSTVLGNLSAGARISSPGGAFAFDNVAPGEYVIRADFGRSGAEVEGEFGVLPVTVTGTDLVGLVLRMSAGSSIRGRFRFQSDTGAKEPDKSAIELSPIGVDPDLTPDNVAVAEIHDDWTFEMHGINGKRRLLVGLPPGWALAEISANGNDVTDGVLSFGTKGDSLNDVEVVLTDRIAEVNGTVGDARGRPAAGSHVIVASMDRRQWYPSSRFLRAVLVGQDGTFRVPGLPAATYYVVASTRVPTDGEDAWQDPEFLESIVTRAVTVTLQDGEKHSVHVNTVGR